MKTRQHTSFVILIAIGSLGIANLSNARDINESVDEIIVEGQQIRRSLQDTKESVAIYDRDLIQSQRLSDLRELFNQTANAVEIIYDIGVAGGPFV